MNRYPRRFTGRWSGARPPAASTHTSSVHRAHGKSGAGFCISQHDTGQSGGAGTSATPQAFGYDAQNRLTGGYGKSYSYWGSGRFNAFEGASYTHGTGASGSPYHAVVSTSAGGAFGYDAAGNMTGRKLNSSAPQQTLGWTPANELRWVAEGGVAQETYRYDGEGERVLRSTAGGAVEYVYFPHYETSVQGGVTTATKSYFFGGQRVAQKVGSGALTFLHGDHLGSTVLTTGVAGSKQYQAYGAMRSGSVASDWQYTGQEVDGTGLVYLHARYYDPATGQFLSPDTIIPDPADVFSYNRFMYARANPLRYTDPSGHQSCAAGDNGCWEAVWYAKNQWYEAHGFGWGINHWDVLIEPRFASEEILDTTVAEIGISWDAQDGGAWNFTRKYRVAQGAVKLGQKLSGGLSTLNGLIGRTLSMVADADSDLFCRFNSSPCTMSFWSTPDRHVVNWPTAFLDAPDIFPNYVAAAAAHEIGHVIDWQSGGSVLVQNPSSYSGQWSHMSPLTNYGATSVFEKWADTVAALAYGRGYVNYSGATRFSGQYQLQVDMAQSLLSGFGP